MFILRLLFVSMLAFTAVYAQSAPPVCAITAVPAIVRAEGMAERLGDIVLHCTGAPGTVISGNLTLNLSTGIANRESGNQLDVLLALDTGSGAALVSVPATRNGASQVFFPGLRWTVGATGAFDLRITNLRGDATQAGPSRNITAQLAFDAPGLSGSSAAGLTVGVPQRGLLASSVSALVCSQAGSPVPDTLGFGQLIAAGTQFSSTRVTEGFASAFEPRAPMTGNGVRLVLRYSNVPSGARLFVPDFIAGSNAASPTAAGDYKGSISGGVYNAGSHTLVLARVMGADSNGAGGLPLPTPSGAPFDTVAELAVGSGSATAVYEVIDSDPRTIESAQIPTFLGLPPSPEQRNTEIRRDIFFGPVSTQTGPAPGVPVPRFAAVEPDNDCAVWGDCGQLIPKLEVPYADSLSFDVTAGSPIYRERYIYIRNGGGGRLQYTARIEYKTGDAWLRITPGPNDARVDLNLAGLGPGTYQADIVIDAGSAGLQRLPAAITVHPSVAAKPVVKELKNGATFLDGPVAVGSLVTLKGANLSGSQVSVAFDGLPARIFYASSGQLNVQVPVELGATVSAQVVVTVDGVAADPLTVNFISVAPGIFAPGILNQDNTVNSMDNPATAGTVVQIFATGLLLPDGSGVVDVKLHDLWSARRPFAGPAPGLPGVQQVNLWIPDGWPTMTTEVLLCSTAAGQRACSPPVKISIRQQ